MERAETSGWLIWRLAHKPMWFAGIAAIIVGFLLQAAALATGPITLVQPTGDWGYRRHHALRAAYLGVATSMGFGLAAGLVASVTAAFAGGGLGVVFTSWQTYLLIIVGPGFFVLLQETMKAGRLIASQPGLTLSNPIVAFGIGITIFGERIRTGGWLAGAVFADRGVHSASRPVSPP